jgi:hypothetical protein
MGVLGLLFLLGFGLGARSGGHLVEIMDLQVDNR